MIEIVAIQDKPMIRTYINDAVNTYQVCAAVITKKKEADSKSKLSLLINYFELLVNEYIQYITWYIYTVYNIAYHMIYEPYQML